MQRDFTITIYKALIEALLNQGFSFITFNDFIVNHVSSKNIILRHDVDKLPYNSLKFASIEAEIRLKGTYYFRAVSQSFDAEIIEKIAGMGHEVGYHYEDFVFVRQKAEGGRRKGESDVEYEKRLVGIAIESFSKNLEKLRRIVPVNTICMHGSPMSRWDSRLLWKYYDYRDFGIIGEPYFDIDFDEVLYLTDTGRRWDGGLYNIRDKGYKAEGARAQSTFAKASADKGHKGAKEKEEQKKEKNEEKPEIENPFQAWKVKPIKYRSDINKNHVSPSPIPPFSLSQYKFHSTSDIIKAAENGQLPDKIMMTFHPQRWTDKPLPWSKELIWQNVKNAGKYLLIKIRG